MEINPHLELPLDDFIEKNIKLGHKIANRFRKVVQSKRIEYEEVLNLALMGMTKAYKKYDPTKFQNVSAFSTYAVPMMIGEVQRYLRDFNPGVKYSRSIKEVANKIRQNEWEKENPKWIAKQIPKVINYMPKVSVETVKDALEYLTNANPRSMDDIVHENDGDPITLGDQLASNQDYSSIYVQEFLSTLPERDRQILKSRMDGATQQEIGERFGVTQVQVSRLIKKIGERLLDYNKKGEDDMAKHKGDRAYAIELLRETKKTYKEVAESTGVPVGTVAHLALKHRPEHIRREMAAANKMGSSVTKKVEKKQEKETVYPDFSKEPVLQKKPVKVEVSATQPEPQVPLKSIAQAVEEFKEEIREEVKKEMADDSSATQTSKGVIVRKITFKYDGSGEEVSTQDFKDELESLIATLEESGNETVTFSIQVKAE
jgi:RNA polymerase sigma factor (sigma-70 family)